MSLYHFNIKSISKIILFEFAMECVSLTRINVHFLSMLLLFLFLFIYLFVFWFSHCRILLLSTMHVLILSLIILVLRIVVDRVKLRTHQSRLLMLTYVALSWGLG